MNRTLTIPDHLYSRLAAEAHSEGLASVEEWLQKMAAALPGRVQQPAVSSARQGTGPAVIGHALDEFIGDWSEAEEREFLDAEPSKCSTIRP